MNERIQQIAESCGIYISQFEPDNVLNNQLEKFAKAIVEMCIAELECNKIGDPYTGRLYECERNTTLDDQIDWLTEYFLID